jgi:hypothetical protein
MAGNFEYSGGFVSFNIKVKNILEKIMPDIVIEQLDRLAQPKWFSLKYKAKKYFLNLNYDEQEPEIIEIIDYFRKHRFSAIPYKFNKNYFTSDICVYYDKKNRMCYVKHNNKRLYFPQNWDKDAVREYYNGLRIEQDNDSPHKYEKEGFSVTNGDIIADVGAAEGIWSLDNVEKAEKIYLFECDEKWIEALEKTFEPWHEKIEIINKYVSDINDDSNVTLDKFFANSRLNVIKADIEGMEIKLLEGGKELLKREDNLKLFLCAYHGKNDADIFKNTLEDNGYKTQYSKGYIIYIYDQKFEEPYIRHGIIFAKK